MAKFSVVLLTAPPPGLAAETGGAYVKVDGRESLMRAVELFLNRPPIVQIQVVVAEDFAEEAKRKYGGHLGFSGVKMLTGGPRWIDQIAAAAGTISPDATHVMLHDAARPAVPYNDLDALLESADKHPAVTLAAPLRTGLVEVDEGSEAVAFHLPQQFMHVLTPQVFQKAVFAEMAKTKQEPHASKFTLLKASPLNVRVSNAGDAIVAKSMIHLLPKPKMKASENPFEEAQW